MTNRCGGGLVGEEVGHNLQRQEGQSVPAENSTVPQCLEACRTTG